jgi:type I restriction enzyme M protein
MPSGVFKPYAGVSTAVLIFTKTNSGGTDNVWFYDMQADGYSLDDKRNPTEANDIPDIVKRFHNLKDEKKRKRIDKSFLVPVKEIQDNKYDLSINRYKEVVYEEKVYEKPEIIIGQIEALDKERADLLKQLKGMLK